MGKQSQDVIRAEKESDLKVSQMEQIVPFPGGILLLPGRSGVSDQVDGTS